MGLPEDPGKIVLMTAVLPWHIRQLDERGETFEMNGNTYAEDLVGIVRVKSVEDSRLEAAAGAERLEIQLRSALRACVAAGVPDSGIVEIVNLELVGEVMEL